MAVHFCNAYTLSLTARDRDFAASIDAGDLNLLDGTPTAWIARRLGLPQRGPVPGPVVMGACLDRGRATGIRHYLYGSTPRVIGRLTAGIAARWPGAVIVGAEAPPFRVLSEAEEAELVGRITSTQADIVWVGLGTPKQDQFVARFRNRLDATVVAVGAAFDFHAGTLDRAPDWMHGRGIEWLYRLVKEPKRLWRRYLIGNSVFVLDVLRHPPRLSGAPEAGNPNTRGVVVIAGPDGAGKSTIADAIADRATEMGVEVLRSHWAPGIILPFRGASSGPVVQPHAEPPRSALMSSAKVVLSAIDVWLAYAGPWRRQRKRGLVLWERSWFDQLVDPARYRLHPAATRVAQRIARFIPRADVVVLTEGDPDAIHERKPELPADEVARQLATWNEVLPSVAHTMVRLETVSVDAERAGDAAWHGLRSGRSEPTLRWRRVPLTPGRVSLEASGGRAALAALEIYRPGSARARRATPMGRAIYTAGLARRGAAPPAEVIAMIRARHPAIDGWAVMQSWHDGRMIVGASHRGRLVTVAKVGSLTDLGLANEAAVLEIVPERDLPFAVPSIQWTARTEERQILALEPLTLTTAPVRDDQVVDIAVALHEMGVVHGDFAPWNLGWGGSIVAVIDWEAAMWADAPLYDLAHFVAQRGALLGAYPPDAAVELLMGDGSLGTAYLRAIGHDPAEAPTRLMDYLRSCPPPSDARAASYRSRMQELVP